MKFEISDEGNAGEYVFVLKNSDGKFAIETVTNGGDPLDIKIIEYDKISLAKQFRLMANFLEDN